MPAAAVTPAELEMGNDVAVETFVVTIMLLHPTMGTAKAKSSPRLNQNDSFVRWIFKRGNLVETTTRLLDEVWNNRQNWEREVVLAS